MLTLGGLIESCQLRTGWADSAYRSRWINFINQSIREFSRRQPWVGLEDTITLKTDGTKFLVCPHYVDTIISLLNITDSSPIERGNDFEKTDPAIWAQGTAGRPLSYNLAGDVPVTKDPVGYLWFKSAHASDIGPLYITGIVANSGASGALERTFKELSVSATGTSPVTLSVLFSKVFSIAKSSDTNGDFFFYDAGASNAHLSFLGKTDYSAAFKRLALLYKPDAQRSIDLRFRYKIPPLRQDAQAPHPSVKSDFIVEHALSLHWAEQEQLTKSQLAEKKGDRVLEAESNKDENFNEPSNRMLPSIPWSNDPSDDYYRGW